jgi:hypothetical protein
MLIGLCGAMKAGKSTAAEHLVEAHGFFRMRFAGPLKEMLKCLGLTQAEIDGDLKETPCAKLGGKTPRHAMQTLGTEWGRNLIWGDLWTDALRRSVEVAMACGGDVVIDDVRFPNEVKMIEELGGHVICIERIGTGGVGHASEQQLLNPGITIQNNSSIRDLHNYIDFVVNNFTSVGSAAPGTRKIS